MTTNNPQEFWTNDLYFAAYLQAAGIQLLRSDRDSRNRVTFIFSNADQARLESVRKGWFDGTGLTPAQAFANSIRSLKSIVHSCGGM